MRIARPVGLALVSLGLLVLPGLPAAQADSTVVVDGPNGFPADGSLALFASSCNSNKPGVGPPAHWDQGPFLLEDGPTPVPSGSITWGLKPNGDHFGAGPIDYVASIGDLTTAQAEFYADSGPARGIAFALVDPEDNDHNIWAGNAIVNIPPGTWTTVSAADKSFAWREIDETGEQVASFTGTTAELLTDLNTGAHPGAYGLGFGCNASTSGVVHFDKALFGTDTDVTTYDFETAETQTTIKATPKTITAGKPVTFKGVMTDIHGTTFNDVPLDLQAKAYGSLKWKTVDHATENPGTSSGKPATLKEKPKTTTRYRWVWSGNVAAPASTSPALTVKVRAALTARPTATSVRKGGTITVKGKVSPKKAHATITLMKGSKKIGSARTSANGSYTVKAKAKTTGSWKLHTATGATKGNVAGTSKTFTVKVGSGRSSAPTHRQPTTHVVARRPSAPHPVSAPRHTAPAWLPARWVRRLSLPVRVAAH
jgi:hypothetical protein